MGLLSNLISSLAALFETDLKKIVALSTLSQLGLMIIAVGLGLPMVAFFHLVVHAIFKALLFICTGVGIHLSEDYQDIRVIGGMYIAMPTLRGVVLLCNFRLLGFPFIAAFFSKEVILEFILTKEFRSFFYFMFIFRIRLTVVYSLRFLVMFSLRPYDYFSLRLKRGLTKEFMLRIIILVRPALGVGYIFNKYAIDYVSLRVSPLRYKVGVIGVVFLFLFIPFLGFPKKLKLRKVR